MLFEPLAQLRVVDRRQREVAIGKAQRFSAAQEVGAVVTVEEIAALIAWVATLPDGVSLPVLTPASQMTARRSSTPPQPLGIRLKSFLPAAFCSAQKVQWSVAVVCRLPLCRPFHKNSLLPLGRKGGLITWAAAVAKSGWR